MLPAFTVLNGSMSVPVVANIPHASSVIPDTYRSQFVLSDPELGREQAAIVDWFTDDLYAPIVSKGGAALVASMSRLVLDTERYVDDDQEIMASRGVGVIYQRTTRGQILRRDLAARERSDLIETVYKPYHAALTELVLTCIGRFGRCLILDCHSYPELALPYELNPSAPRPEICFGTDRHHSPAPLLEKLERVTRNYGWSVARDTPFAGTIVPLSLYRDPRITSVMLEVRRDLYMDEATTRRSANFERVQSWVTELVSAATNDA